MEFSVLDGDGSQVFNASPDGKIEAKVSMQIASFLFDCLAGYNSELVSLTEGGSN